MKCPKCSSSFSGKPNDAGLLTCPSCGARLRTKTAAVFKAAKQAEPPPPPEPAAKPEPVAKPPPKPEPVAKSPRPEPVAEPPKSEPVAEPPKSEPKLPVSPADTIMARVEAHPPFDVNATIPRGMVSPGFSRRATPGPMPKLPSDVTPEALMVEIQAIRKTQLEILALLQGGAAAQSAATPAGPAGVLVVDDDAAARAEIMSALADDGVAAREAPDGSEALAAIATQKPLVIVLEPDIGGAMPGRDVLSMVKATMEWLDIPVILYTRATIGSEEEARTDYGADHLVHKGAGSSVALVALVHELLEKA
jgi:CheY-like chemotaxis protein